MRILVAFVGTETAGDYQVAAATPTEFEQHEIANQKRGGFVAVTSTKSGLRMSINLANTTAISYPDFETKLRAVK